jgi:hypothetical protein
LGQWISEAEKWTPDLKLAELGSETLDADVLIVRVTLLQTNNQTRQMLATLSFRYLIVDEAHLWVKGSANERSNQLMFYRETLLPKAKAVYLLSGTPFPHKMQFDLIETLKSLATPERREQWTVKVAEGIEVKDYTDAALAKLKSDWQDIPAAHKTQMLVPLMIRRTAKSKINGQPVLEDFVGKMVEVNDGEIYLAEMSDEIVEREAILDQLVGPGNTNRINRFCVSRWLAWTPWLVEHSWVELGRDNPTWWDDFTLMDAERYARGRRLVRILERMKSNGDRPLIFAYAVFHQQFAARVLSPRHPC